MKIEIDTKKECEIDWDKQNLLVNKYDSKVIVLTTGSHKEDNFQGVNIGRPCFLEWQSNYWSKDCFKLYNGSVKISND